MIRITIGSIAAEMATSLEDNFIEPLVAMNKYATAEILEKLVRDESSEVANRALQNPNVSYDLLCIYQHSEQ